MVRWRTATVALLSLAGFSSVMGRAATPPAGAREDPWAGWRFVVGEWAGEGSGRPGEGAGSFSFRFDLGEKVLMRRSHTEYPAQGQKAAFVHDDVMICYPEPAGDRILAIYFDNEGHVIHYTADASRPGRVVLVSEASGSSPGFRLTYTQTGPDAVTIEFEIAPPDRPGEFVPYLTGRAVRTASR
jgi:hypothetical protein